MSTSQDPTGQPLRSGGPLSQGPRSDQPVSHRQLPRTLFWVLIATLYLLGALSLLVRGWFDLGLTDAGSTTAVTTAATVAATAISTMEPPVAITLAPATATVPPPTPFPTLTPRRTLYPTLTPRP